MSGVDVTDKEVAQINEKRMKEKGLAVKAKQEVKYNPEDYLFDLLEIMRIRGLEMMNISEQVKAQIYKEKQKKLEERNGLNQ